MALNTMFKKSWELKKLQKALMLVQQDNGHSATHHVMGSWVTLISLHECQLEWIPGEGRCHGLSPSLLIVAITRDDKDHDGQLSDCHLTP
jgi:hypothetical protein